MQQRVSTVAADFHVVQKLIHVFLSCEIFSFYLLLLLLWIFKFLNFKELSLGELMDINYGYCSIFEFVY